MIIKRLPKWGGLSAAIVVIALASIFCGDDKGDCVLTTVDGVETVLGTELTREQCELVCQGGDPSLATCTWRGSPVGVITG